MDDDKSVYSFTSQQMHEIRNFLEIILVAGSLVEQKSADEVTKTRMQMLIIAAERIGNIVNSICPGCINEGIS